MDMDFLSAELDFTYSELLSHPDDIMLLLEVDYMFLFTHNSYLSASIKDALTSLVELKDFPPILDFLSSLSTLFRSHVGYLNGAYCSICDPIASKSLETSFDITPESCYKLYESFNDSILAFSTLLRSDEFKERLIPILVDYCEEEHESNAKCSYENLSKVLHTFLELFINEKSLFKILLGTKTGKEAKHGYCENMFQGLYLNYRIFLQKFTEALDDKIDDEIVGDWCVSLSHIFHTLLHNMKDYTYPLPRINTTVTSTHGYDIYGKREFKMSRTAFTKSNLDTSGNWNEHKKHSIMWTLITAFFKLIFYCCLLACFGYAALLAYNKYKERQGESGGSEYYSMLSGSGM